MKIVEKEDAVAFQPVTLEVTIETPEELRALYALGNWSAVVAAFVEQRGSQTDRQEIDKVLTVLYHATKPLLER